MTVAIFPGRDFTTDMQAVADAARRNTHLIVATHKRTGERQSWHARPRREARECRNLRRETLGGEWAVKIVALRRWWR